MSKLPPAVPTSKSKQAATTCYHCGTVCLSNEIKIAEKHFCCDGCKLVYEILNSNGLCNYYDLEQHPGLQQIKAVRKDKFAFLDDEQIAARLCSFKAGDYSIVTFYLPGVHCASCMWLLEHLYRINPAITQSRLSFSTKEVTIHFRHADVSLREVAELLSMIGYEPYISLEDADKTFAGRKHYDYKRIYKLGVAGFCFGNIMMMAFPEYFGGSDLDHNLEKLFRYLSLALSIPVVFYAASEFFANAWAGLRNKTLNIDAPIALAILITYTRSLYEIGTGTGSGYLDSMSGIVFFMLVGRAVQERTYRSISFHRDYKSYFPIAVTAVTDDGLQSRSLHDLKPGDVVQLANEELIPADGIMLTGEARIDYSFVTGESEPIHARQGDHVYAGGRQTSGIIRMLVEKPVAGSYLTSLWNNHAFSKDKQTEAYQQSSVHRLSNWFTVVLFTLAAFTAAWWGYKDPSRILPAVSAMLIVACPCALLLSATFTNGSMMRLLSDAGLYLRDSTVIESLSKIKHIVFDKTGTLTTGNSLSAAAEEHTFSEADKKLVYAVASRSNHPRSRALVALLGKQQQSDVSNWEEVPGDGVRGIVDGHRVLIGNTLFTGSPRTADLIVRVDGNYYYFLARPELRPGVRGAIGALKLQYQLSLLSGDNARQQAEMQNLIGKESTLLFDQKPGDKLSYIQEQQRRGQKVLMIGDGLNDAGALQQSDVGITLAEDVNNFTPSCDAILDARMLDRLPQLLSFARWGNYTIRVAFAISILYNTVGLYFSMQGILSPVVAAILMPASTLSIVLISVGLTSLMRRVLLGSGPQRQG